MMTMMTAYFSATKTKPQSNEDSTRRKVVAWGREGTLGYSLLPRALLTWLCYWIVLCI